MKSGFNQISENEFLYIPEKYDCTKVIDVKPSKELQEYHKNSCVQINVGEKTYIRKVTT